MRSSPDEADSKRQSTPGGSREPHGTQGLTPKPGSGSAARSTLIVITLMITPTAAIILATIVVLHF